MKLNVFRNQRAYGLVCISDVPEDFQTLESKDSKEKGQKCHETQSANIKIFREESVKSQRPIIKDKSVLKSKRAFNKLRTQSVRWAKGPQEGRKTIKTKF